METRMIAGKYDAMCMTLTTALDVRGCLLIVFDGSKEKPGIGMSMPEAIYEALPSHLSGIIDDIEIRQRGGRMLVPNWTTLGGGTSVMRSPAGLAINLIDHYHGTMFSMKMAQAAALFDWMKDNLPDPQLPELTQEVIEQARACKCGECEACKAVLAAAGSLADVENE